jgi:hypothetical protein
MNASLGQYQSFALISYDAIRRQTANVNASRRKGNDVTAFVRKLYVAKKLTDTVFYYSTSVLSYEATENQIIDIAGWLQKELMFTCGQIPQLPNVPFGQISQLPPTYENGPYDFDPYDFSHSNPADFN